MSVIIIYCICSLLAVSILSIADGYSDLKCKPNDYLVTALCGPLALVVMLIAFINLTGVNIGRYFRNDK